MGRMLQDLLTLSMIAVVAFLAGCTSSAPSTTQAPPETPERQPAATGAKEGEQGEGGGAGAGQPGSGAGEGEAGEGSEASAGGGEGEESGSRSGGGVDNAGHEAGGQPPAGSPATGSEAAATLDRQLDGALEEFDRRMREEMQRLAEETADAERAASQEVNGSAGAADPSGGGATGESGTSEGQSEGGSEEGGDSAGSVGGSGPGGTGSDRVPPDVGDGSDDDIVARQLREAAMAEDDPELREKLWDEYRRYKATLGGSNKDGS